VEKTHSNTDIESKINNLDSIQTAAFMTDTLWDNFTTLKVSFFQSPSEDKMPTWYTFEQVLMGAPSGTKIDPIEYEARKISNLNDIVKYVIQQKLEPLVNIKFDWVDNTADGDIRVAFDTTKGSWSYVGKQCLTANKNEQTVNFGWLDVGTIIHEFCHVLGMIHEHQNPYGKGIDWNEDAVYDWASETQGWDEKTTYNNIIKKYDKNIINGSNFDPQSIMLYFYPPELTNNNKGTYANHTLSITDSNWLSSVYPKSGQRKFPMRGKGDTLIFETDGDKKETKKLSWYIIIGVILLLVILILILFN
jgi:hypothetical protein